MMRGRLRVYTGPDGSEDALPVEGPVAAHRVTVPLSEIFPLLADAQQSQRTWLADFADDEITISTDLYELLLAYEHYRRPSA